MLLYVFYLMAYQNIQPTQESKGRRGKKRAFSKADNVCTMNGLGFVFKLEMFVLISVIQIKSENVYVANDYDFKMAIQFI